MNKVLITGAAGYIGSTLTYLLLENGYEVIGVDNLKFGFEPLLGAIRNPRFKLVRCDINDVDAYGKYVDENTAVVNLAAIVGEPACKKYADEAVHTNYDGAKAVINLAKAKNVAKLIFATTCSNYGMVPQGQVAVEESELNPLGLYAQSKVDTEKYLIDTVGKSLNWTILRFSTVYGIGPRMRFDLTVNEFAAYGYLNKMLEVFLPKTVRPYVHVYDVARAIKLVIEKSEDSRNEIFNVGDSRDNFEKQQIVDAVKEVVPDLEIKYVEVGTDLRDYRVGFDKIKNKLGYAVTMHVPDGIAEIIDAVSTKAIPDVDRATYRNHL
jgi:Nucleoside-diphosphate-sugar epimerases